MRNLIDDIIEKLKVEKNIILYGPPGTGKTYILNEIKKRIGEDNIYYDPTDIFTPIVDEREDDYVIEWCTFHPNYSYEDFIVRLQPKIVNNQLGYEYISGPFLNLALKSEQGRKTLLIIDEINRAKTDDVFGDAIGLISKNNRLNNYVSFTEEIELCNGEKVKEMRITDDFFTLGTMNSLDKSVNPLDPMLKTRFKIIELMPDVSILKENMDKNPKLSVEFKKFVVGLFNHLNKFLREYVGKEYELGQGYFWSIVDEKVNPEEACEEVIKYKVLPHIKDVYPSEYYPEIFGVENKGRLYFETEVGNQIVNLDKLNKGELINLFSKAIGSEYICESNSIVDDDIKDFETYQENKINKICTKLKKHKNCILVGVSGVGKTFIINEIRSRYDAFETMTFHSSTGYDDLLMGIGAYEKNGQINYKLKEGKLLKLINKIHGDNEALLVIENLDRGSVAEIFGELITLLEPDKRQSIAINTIGGEFQLPTQVEVIASMAPVDISPNKIDSAIKRRFDLIDLYPDYRLLELWFGITRKEVDIDKISKREDILNLAIFLLERINNKIIMELGEGFQIGHGVIWDYKQKTELSLQDLFDTFDETILGILQDNIIDVDKAYSILGRSNPLIKIRKYGFELQNFSHIDYEHRIEALREICGYGVD